MKAEKIVWCKVNPERCPHLIDGQCFADELHLGMAEENIGFYCETLFEITMSRVRGSASKVIEDECV